MAGIPSNAGIASIGYDRLAASRALLAAQQQGRAGVGVSTLASTGLPRGADTVTLSKAAKPLDELRGLIAGLRQSFSRVPVAGIASVRGELAALASDADRGPGNTLIRPSLGVASADLYFAELEPGERVDLDATVTQSAQRGTLFLQGSVGAQSLDLEGGSFLTLEIAGNLGSQTISFASGQTFETIANLINVHSKATGVAAALTSAGGGITLTSAAFGLNEFVSVRSVPNPDGSLERANLSLFGADPGNVQQAGFKLADFGEPFTQGGQDYGQNLGVEIEGVSVETYGLDILFHSDRFGGRFALDPLGGLNTPGFFRLGSIIQPGGQLGSQPGG